MSNLKCQMKSGFTLVELLVAITVMGIMGVFVISNYRTFGEDQSLKGAVLDVQSLLRQAQTNATTNTKCNNEYGATWQVEFNSDRITIYLKCTESGTTFTKKTLKLDTPNPKIRLVPTVASGCPGFPGSTISFILLSGNVDFGSAYPNCLSVRISLENTQTTSTKTLIIEKGGRIYEQ